MKYLFIILALCFFQTNGANANQQLVENSDPEVVKEVQIDRYLGLWYEIGHFPNFFQKGCLRSTAEYGLLPSGEISVLNVCYRKGNITTPIQGKAFAPNKAEPAKLKVDFGFPKLGDYWIIDLDSEYQWAVVSGPGKDSLFILSRTAPMEYALMQSIFMRLQERGFDITKIILDEYSL